MGTPDTDYDVLILGGGCAGLSLAQELAQQPALQNMSVGVVERQAAMAHKTWCFWAEDVTPYTQHIRHSWSQLTFAGARGVQTQPLRNMQYHCMPSEGYLGHLRGHVQQQPQVTGITSSVRAARQIDSDRVAIDTDHGELTARWVFNSIPQLSTGYAPLVAHTLWQHFVGWEVETERPCFNPEALTLMDFRVSQQDGASFMYVLPFSETRALIEFTVFSGQTFPQQIYEAHLKQYLQQHWQLAENQYAIVYEEAGKIPMSAEPFPRQNSPRLINIGTAGGMTKPSTGYTFLRIHEDSKALAEQLAAGNALRGRSDAAARFAFYDKLLLWIIRHRPAQVKLIMESLFGSQRYAFILRFLDERSSLPEEAAMFLRLPWGPFLKALRAGYLRI